MNAPPYTVTKLVRWRVKDWVSCFHACKLPLEEDIQTNNPATAGVIRETMIVKSKVGSNQKLAKKDKEEGESSSSSSSGNKLAKKKEIGEVSSRWPSFADDHDYIVFCFGDEGEIHVLPEKNSNVVETSSTSSNTRRLNLQLLRLEDEAARNETDSNDKAKGKEAAICSSDEITEVIEEEESEEGRGISSDSNDQSDAASTSSFAFPIIQGEWIGSPVQMPKAAKVQKPKNNRVHCCRF